MNAPIWINTGELSGDMHGALLVKALAELAPDQSFAGMGGPYLRNTPGFECLFRTEDLSVMGITEVLGHLPRIFRLLRNIRAELAGRRPRAVIVIDAPDFHFRVIKAASSLGIPVYYYISPKVWAWRRNRVLFIKKNVQRLLSILPFEVPFYKRYGMDVDYVGNPLVDAVDYPSLEHIAPEPGKIGLLPGSRAREISGLVPEFGKAAALMLREKPSCRFQMVRAPGVEEGFLRSFWPAGVPLDLLPPENRYAFMRSCEMLIAASGTVTLEAALAGTPTLVTYKVSPLSFALGKRLVKVPFISLPNLILEREVFPELLQEACDAENLAGAALRWLEPAPCEQPSPLVRIRRELEELRRIMGGPGAPARAAEIILHDLGTRG
jgi:lipid-A-disaccharide synthase